MASEWQLRLHFVVPLHLARCSCAVELENRSKQSQNQPEDAVEQGDILRQSNLMQGDQGI
jgi:hypothetical protein